MQEQLEEGLIPCVEISSKRKPHIVSYLIQRQLRSYFENRDNLFERVYPVSENIAYKLLSSGYKQLTSCAKWDPVKVRIKKI